MDRICTYTRKRIYNIDPFTQLFAIALVKKVFLTEKIETFERERERERKRGEKFFIKRGLESQVINIKNALCKLNQVEAYLEKLLRGRYFAPETFLDVK